MRKLRLRAGCEPRSPDPAPEVCAPHQCPPPLGSSCASALVKKAAVLSRPPGVRRSWSPGPPPTPHPQPLSFRLVAASEPLHLQDPLPGVLSPQNCMWLHSAVTSSERLLSLPTSLSHSVPLPEHTAPPGDASPSCSVLRTDKLFLSVWLPHVLATSTFL